MKPIYIYPGTFCPPTYGHLSIVRSASDVFPEITVICSIDPEKAGNWFGSDERQAMWRTYHLPPNVRVETIDAFKATNPDLTKVAIIRGIRDNNDLENENKVMSLNYQKFGINKYFYLISKKEYKHISSSATRALAENLELEQLAGYVSPLIISALLEQTLDLSNLFMVAGKPGSGKSIFLKMLAKENNLNIHINTDDFNQALKPLLEEKFGDQDLIKLALNKEEALKSVIAKPWLALLKESLKSAPPKSNVFVEIPYGLQSDKLMFRFVGGKVIYVGCENMTRNQERNINRGTPELAPFIDLIPGLSETREMAEKYKLNLVCVDTSCSLSKLEEKARQFNQSLRERRKT